MALCKDLETNYGVTASYHKIIDLNISWHKKECSVTISSFLSEQARLDNKSALRTAYFDYNEDKFNFNVEHNITEQLYSKIKQESDFINATDC